MTEPNDIAALDDIAFLARSASRVRVLETLASDPHDRAELQAATDISRVTVGGSPPNSRPEVELNTTVVATYGTFDSGEPVSDADARFEYTFDRPGTYTYACEPGNGHEGCDIRRARWTCRRWRDSVIAPLFIEHLAGDIVLLGPDKVPQLVQILSETLQSPAEPRFVRIRESYDQTPDICSNGDSSPTPPTDLSFGIYSWGPYGSTREVLFVQARVRSCCVFSVTIFRSVESGGLNTEVGTHRLILPFLRRFGG